MSFIQAQGIVKSYEVGGSRLTILRGLELEVAAGEMVAIVGASGVGKSTLLHILGGLDRADEGTLAVGDGNLTTMADQDIVAFRNRRIGFVFQFHHLLPEFTAVENAEMPMRIARLPVGDARQRAAELLRRVVNDRFASLNAPVLGAPRPSRDKNRGAVHAKSEEADCGARRRATADRSVRRRTAENDRQHAGMVRTADGDTNRADQLDETIDFGACTQEPDWFDGGDRS